MFFKKSKINKEVLIIGASGLLGSKLQKFFPYCFAPSHQELDIEKEIIKSKFCKKNDYKKIKTVIHCAALKNVTECEKNKIRALETNVIGTYNVAIFCNKIKAKLVYISTNYVFKGDRGNYKPEDEFYPTTYYGETKLAGEFVSKSVDNHLIIRLSFSEDVFLYEDAFIDQISTKITASEAARRIFELIKNEQKGIKHIAGKKQSIYDFAKTTREKVNKIKMDEKKYFGPKDASLIE